MTIRAGRERILVAVRDPGGANVVSELLQFLPRRDDISIWTFKEASPAFKRNGFDAVVLEREPDAGELSKAFGALGPVGGVVTGTSHHSLFESSLWALSRNLETSSLALVDSWCNLDRRFQFGRPEFVGAIDEIQRTELIAMDWAPEKVIVTGHPWVEALARKSKESGLRVLRDKVATVLFVSEPISQDVKRKCNDKFGFTEQDSFNRLISAIQASEGVINVFVKMHPLEDPEVWESKRLSRENSIKGRIDYISGNETIRAVVPLIDMVVGIGSMLMIECLAEGFPVISLQPGLIREDTCILSERGYIKRVSNEESIVHDLLEVLESSMRVREEMVLSSQEFFENYRNETCRESVCSWLDVEGGSLR